MKSFNPLSSAQKLFLFVVIIVVAFACFIRLANLHAFPPILNRDEAAIALNAKFILEKGIDEWGKPYPLQFKSFGDYKLPGYIYLTSLSFSIFGYHDWAVRLPSALAGIGIVVVGGLLIQMLLSEHIGLKIKDEKVDGNKLVLLLAMFMLTLSPVFFFYSRMGWEANVGLFFLLSGLCVVFSDLLHSNTKISLWKVAVSTIFILLAVFTYNTPLLLLPFLLPIPILLTGVRNWRKWLPIVLGWSIVLVIGLISLLSVADQKSGITIFSDETITIAYPTYRAQFPMYLQSLFGNKYLYWMSIVVDNYFATFSPKFLVTQGGSHPWHSILGRGHLYWSTYLLFVFGVSTLIIQLALKVGNALVQHRQNIVQRLVQSLRNFFKINSNQATQTRTQLLLVYLLLISPIPAVITVDAPHATRSLFTFFMIITIAVYGLIVLFYLLEQRKQWGGVITLVLILSIFSLESSRYVNQFFYQWRNQLPTELEAGFRKQLHTIAKDHSSQPVVVIDKEGYLYSLTTWYLPVETDQFFNTIDRHDADSIGLHYGYKVGNIRFVKDQRDREPEETIMIVKQEGEWKIQTF